MLAATAARTGGLCMACKHGIRRDIEAAKFYYQQQRQPDPFRDLWTALVRRVHGAPDGFYRLSHQERTYYLVSLLQGEVFNGGIGQFFDNSSADYYRETLDALLELGAMRSHTLLLAAQQVLFPNGDPPREQRTRCAIMPEHPESPDEPRPAWDLELERISREFCSDPDRLNDRLRSYALSHALVRI